MISTLSAKSFGKIFDALNSQQRSLKNFQHTSYRINRLAEQLGKQWKSDIYDIRLYHRHKDSPVPTDRLCLYIYSTAEKMECPMTQRTDHVMSHFIGTKKRDKFLISGSGDESLYSPQKAVDCAKNLLKRALKNVRSINSLTLMKLDIDRDFFDQFGSMRIPALTLDGFSYNLHGKDLLFLIQKFHIKALTLSGDLSNMQLNSMHFALLTEGITLNGLYLTCPAEYSDPPEQILTNWLYKTPKAIDFFCRGVVLPLDSVLTFIQDLALRIYRNNDTTPRNLYIGEVGYYDEIGSRLVLAQRNPLLEWDFDENWSNCCFREVTVIGFPTKISFYLVNKRVHRITHAQATKKMIELQEYMRDRQEENIDYVSYADYYLLDEIATLRGQIYDDWYDLLACFIEDVPPFMLK